MLNEKSRARKITLGNLDLIENIKVLSSRGRFGRRNRFNDFAAFNAARANFHSSVAASRLSHTD
jgi:hypothetical protein